MFNLNMLTTITVHPSADLKHHLLLTPQIIIQEMALFQITQLHPLLHPPLAETMRICYFGRITQTLSTILR
jgi:hypothetical protein